MVLNHDHNSCLCLPLIFNTWNEFNYSQHATLHYSFTSTMKYRYLSNSITKLMLRVDEFEVNIWRRYQQPQTKQSIYLERRPRHASPHLPLFFKLTRGERTNDVSHRCSSTLDLIWLIWDVFYLAIHQLRSSWPRNLLMYLNRLCRSDVAIFEWQMPHCRWRFVELAVFEVMSRGCMQISYWVELLDTELMVHGILRHFFSWILKESAIIIII